MRFVASLVLVGLIALGCAGSADVVAEPAASATATDVPATPDVAATATPIPTAAAIPTATTTPVPTTAPIPTATPEPSEPTATPEPTSTPEPPAPPPGHHDCTLVQGAPGPAGELALDVDVIASGLVVPWGLAVLPDGDLLVTERPGRVRIVDDGELVAESVLTIEVSIPAPLFGVDTLSSEGGLLGVVLHPDFESNRLFYLFANFQTDGEEIGRVDRYALAADGRSATFDRTIIDDLPAGVHHQGGRMAIGPDGLLYVAVGAWEPELAQDPNDLQGKLLRMGLDGELPPDNPTPGSYVYVSGMRNAQGFDWFDDEHLVMTGHGPSGLELDMPELRGFDEINVARAGENLGWPRVWGCEQRDGLVQPLLSWETSVPPTGATFYRGDLFPWSGRYLVTSVGGAIGRSNGRHLHVIEFADGDPYSIESREVYLWDDYGRLRTVVVAPDGSLLMMTSNCDNRGTCPAERDVILRITPAS